jgi:hypothetical protein
VAFTGIGSDPVDVYVVQPELGILEYRVAK